MKIKSKTRAWLGMALVLPFFLFAFTSIDQGGGKWVVPDAAKKTKNPVAASKENLAAGKIIWAKHCKSCHGTKGKGDGPKAGEVKTEMPDLSLAATQSQTDGELFYKTKEGRDDMPGYKKKIPDAEDIWTVVNYMRTLK